MRPLLPLEIQHHILGFLWRFPSTLCCCALVCRAWLIPSRSYLFYTAKLRNLFAFHRLAQLAITSSDLRKYFEYTRELIVYPNTPASGQSPSTRSCQWAHIVPHLFSIVMRNLRRLEYLRVDWTDISIPPGFYTCISRFTSVTHFKLSDCIFPSFSDLQRLVSALPGVSALYLYGVHWDKANALRRGFTYGDKPRLLSLTMQRLSKPQFNAIAQWIDDTPSRESLKALCVLCDDRERSTVGVAPTTLLKILGLSLEDLSIDLTNWDFDFIEPETDEEPQTLIHSSNLRSLHIIFPTVIERSRALNLVAEMLSQVSSSRLRRLVLDFQALRWIDMYNYGPSSGCQDLDDIKAVVWKVLDEALAQDRFRGLELVEVQGSLPRGSGLPIQDFQLEMESRLPGVVARGIMQVRVHVLDL